MDALTAVTGDTTGGISRTVTIRSPSFFGLSRWAPCVGFRGLLGVLYERRRPSLGSTIPSTGAWARSALAPVRKTKLLGVAVIPHANKYAALSLQ